MTGSGSMSTAPIATRDASASVSISWLISWVAYRAPSSVSAMRSTSAGVWRIQRDASTSDASISVIGWRTSWIVEAKNSSRTVSIRSVSADRASIVAPSMASLTSAIAPTMSRTARSSSRNRWSARAISWRSSRNSVAIATGPSRCSNRIWAWAWALASIASSSIGASTAVARCRRPGEQVHDRRRTARGCGRPPPGPGGRDGRAALRAASSQASRIDSRSTRSASATGARSADAATSLTRVSMSGAGWSDERGTPPATG